MDLNQQNVLTVIAMFFGILALALTCIGLYGLTSWTVQSRTSEIGIRAALGARRESVVRMIVKEVLIQCVAGLLIGIPVALVTARLLEHQLYGVSPADPRDCAIAAAVLILCALAAGYIPAIRASRIEPMTALRYE